MSKVDAATYKQALQKVKQRDPDFYEFLEQQDADLLKFDLSDDDEKASARDDKDSPIIESEVDDDGDEADTDNEKILVDEALENQRLRSKKKYKRTLDEAMDTVLKSEEEEDAFDHTDKDVESKEELTENMLLMWEKNLLSKRHILESIRQLTLAFKAVMVKSGCKVSGSCYVINKPPVYDKALRTCFDKFPEAWQNALTRKALSKNKAQEPSLRFKSKAMKAVIKDYICDVIKFLPEVHNKPALSTMLAHIKNMVEFLVMFPRKSRLMLKALIKIWNMEIDDFKIRAFDCIFDLVSKLKNDLFIFAFKRMYLSYSKCTTLKYSDVTSAEKLDYMQRSFADLCELDPMSVYQNAFVYIRELAIQLRTSIISKKKEALKTVYSRPYVNLLYLWSVVLNKMKTDENIAQLIYPLVQTICGCSRHVTSNKYLPFRLHCLKCLLLLTERSELFVPVFSVVTEILSALNIKQSQSKSGKISDAKCILVSDMDRIVKLSTSQLHDRSYKGATVEKVSDLLVACLERYSSHPCFNEMTFLLDLQLKKFCKESRTVNHKNRAFDTQCCERLKLISKKIEQHAKWIEFQKAKSNINLCDDKNLAQFMQSVSEDSGNQMLSFCNSLKRLNQRQRSVRAADVATINKSEDSKKQRVKQRRVYEKKPAKAESVPKRKRSKFINDETISEDYD